LDVAAFEVIFNSPWISDAIYPSFIIYLANNGKLTVYNIQDEFKFVQCPLPPALDAQQSPVIFSEFFTTNSAMLNDLGQTSSVKWDPSQKPWPIVGGSIFPDEKNSKTTNDKQSIIPINLLKILVTGHANGYVCFWDTSSRVLLLLYRLKISPKDYGKISCMTFCPISRTLVIGTSEGHILIFEFSLEARDIEIWEYGIIKQPTTNTGLEQEKKTNIDITKGNDDLEMDNKEKEKDTDNEQAKLKVKSKDKLEEKKKDKNKEKKGQREREREGER